MMTRTAGCVLTRSEADPDKGSLSRPHLSRGHVGHYSVQRYGCSSLRNRFLVSAFRLSVCEPFAAARYRASETTKFARPTTRDSGINDGFTLCRVLLGVLFTELYRRER